MRYSTLAVSYCNLFSLAALLLLGTANLPAAEKAAEKTGPLATLRAVGPKGAGHEAATAAWQEVAKGDASKLPEVLTALDGASPLAANWIRSAVDAIAERELQRGGKLPVDALQTFIFETKHEPRARRLAFEWLTRVDPTTPDRLVPKFLNDPSVEFRRDAVARLLSEASVLMKEKSKEDAVAVYATALTGARDFDQVEEIVKALRGQKQKVDVPAHFGFILDWKIIGPFDNTGENGFDVAYPPEEKIDLTASYEGKDKAPVKWIDHRTLNDFGKVNFNKALGKANGVIAYAYSELLVDREQEVDVRVGCICAVKVWLNGQLVDSRKVYHSGSKTDQYVSHGMLKPGKNTIMVKVAQNEQKETWAQEWDFQLRVCDSVGTAVLSKDRKPKTEEEPVEPSEKEKKGS
jgi:hypothetical protein